MSVERAARHVPSTASSARPTRLARPLPGIYDWDASHYALELGLALAERLATQLLYVSLTDYVQHREPPGTELSDRFLRRLDELVGEFLDRGWRLGLVADHGMNARPTADGLPNVRYLDDELAAAGVTGVHVILPITDPHVVHHAALGSACWIHLSDAGGRPAGGVRSSRRCRGSRRCSLGDDAARDLRLPRDRIGDLVVLADRDTVLGKSAARPRPGGARGAAALSRRPPRAAGAAAPVRAARRRPAWGCWRPARRTPTSTIS